MKTHFILNPKGGTGKSVIAALLAQYMQENGNNPLCIDTDPSNATLFGYKGLDVKHLQVMNGDNIDSRKFDEMVEIIAASDRDIIIDNGASSFIALANYLISTDIPALLKDMGHEVIIHTIITGGQALLDTVGGFSKLVSQFPDEVKFVVWLNLFWGEIKQDGKVFKEFKAYRNNEHRISAVIEIPEMDSNFGRDFSDMLTAKLTFADALKKENMRVVTRQRLTMIRRDLFGRFGQLAEVA